jgi:hypothetical protein
LRKKIAFRRSNEKNGCGRAKEIKFLIFYQA